MVCFNLLPSILSDGPSDQNGGARGLQGDWLCGDCTEQMDASGAVLVVPSSRNSRTARDMFLSHSLEMMMGRVERIWRDGAKGGYQFTIRWYMLPEETHTGRQAHHARREVRGRARRRLS